MKKSRCFPIFNSLIIACTFPLHAMIIKGIVVDTINGEPLPGILVYIESSVALTHTDSAGAFSLESEVAIKHNIKSFKDNGYLLWDGRRNILKWKAAAPGLIEIFTLQGKHILEWKVKSGLQQLSVPNMANGIYMLRAKLPGRIYTAKIANIKSIYLLEISLKSSISNISGKASQERCNLIFSGEGYLTKEVEVTGDIEDLVVRLNPDLSGYVFDQDFMRTYYIEVEDSIWNWLQIKENTLKEEYVPARFIHKGIDYGEVGLRYKGAVGTLDLCFDEQGNRICPKLSLKIRFNKYNSNTRFYGLKKINLHSMNKDATMMHERLSYLLFQEMGIYSPRAVHCMVYINGEYEGVFVTIEQIDGRFTKNRFPAFGDGNLYKEKWPGTESEHYYLEGLKTNDQPEDNPDVSKMYMFSKDLNSMSDENFIESITDWIDLNYMMRYIAVDRATINWDGIMAWYTGDGWLGNHNYYWYEEEIPNGKYWIIPWDLDNTFARPDPMHESAGVPRWNAERTDCEKRQVFGEYSYVRPPACDHFTGMLAQNAWDLYVYYGEKFLGGPFSSDSMLHKLDRWEAQIDSAAKKDPNIEGYSEWQRNFKSLRSAIPYFREYFLRLIHPPEEKPLPPVDQTPQDAYYGLRIDRDNNFELTEMDENLYNTFAFCNESSEYSYRRNYENPLSANSDVRFEVIFRDDPGYWAEWADLVFQFEGGIVDLSEISRIVIDISSDSRRDIRISLRSTQYPNPDNGVFYGWEQSMDAEEKTIELEMFGLAYPSWDSQDDVMDEVLKNTNGLDFSPRTHYHSDGVMVTDPDSSWVQIDNIRFIK